MGQNAPPSDRAPAAPAAPGELPDSEAVCRRVLKNAPELVLEVDRDGVITYLNRLLPGREPSSMLGTHVTEWIDPTGHDDVRALLRRVFDEGEPASAECVGAVTGRHYVIRGLRETADVGGAPRAVLVVHDVVTQKEFEEQLRDSEQWLRSLVDAAFEGLVVSIDGVVTDVNETFANLAGYSRDELIGKSVHDLTPPASTERVMTHIAARSEVTYEVELLDREGRKIPCELVGRNIAYKGRAARLTSVRDLRERRRAEEERSQLESQLEQAQKLESLGVLAGGIAHDFNNLLQIVLGNIELARLGLPGGPTFRASVEHLDQAREVALRASELTRQMLVYAGKGTIRVQPVALSSVVREMTELLAVTVPKRASLTLDLEQEPPTVDADASQLRQVVLNLVTNAAEALGERSGRLSLTLRRAELREPDLAAMLVDDSPGPGEFALLEVSDDGAGMSPATVGKLFDPFFSTKFAGRGLGLTSVRGIVRAHRGAIAVETQLGTGSTFRVYLPASKGTPAPTVPATEPTPPPQLVGRVLVADDEPHLRQVLGEVLERTGLEVVLAETGRRAVELSREQPGGFDLVVLDVTMPELGGREALREIRAADPTVPALLVSGHAETRLGGVEPAATFLGKPFAIETLMEHVARLLRRRGAGP